MLEIKGLNVKYGDVQALWDLSFAVRRSEIVALVGSNGAGKTTVLRTVSGIQKPQSGTITVDSIMCQAEEAHRIVDIGVSLVPEGRRLFKDMTVQENLELGGYLGRARPVKDDNMRYVFHLFPVLQQRTHQLAGTLSGGEQQMLAIGRALMSDPKLLLVDELSLGLAPIVVKNIYKTLKEINTAKGMTILVVEQNVRLALEVADRAYVIENGRIVMEGTGAGLLSNPEIKNAYLAIG